MQQSNAPSKIYVPFAQNDSSKVNVPVTTTDATRASQSLGFPPLTGQPPESGGVPPQLEDFNGAINQIASIAWWVMGGNFYQYDATFAASSYIGGYANGAKLLRLDNTGDWLNTVDNNVTNPDATDGTAANWTPGYTYGAASISVSSTAITVRPVQAAKKILILTGTLSANTTVTLPAWVYEWTIINNTAMVTFTLLLNTATGTGVYLQAGVQSVRGDGTNIVQDAKSTAPATTPTQYPQAQQVTSGALWTATAGGTANALTASLPFSPNTIASGQEFTVVATAANTSTTVTLALTLGSASAVTYNVTKGNNAALAAGDIPAAGYPCTFAYNPTTGAMVMLNPATGVGSQSGRLINTIYYSVVAQTVTISIASPGVITYSSSSALPRANAPIVFSTTGALPTGITAGTTYYVLSPSGTTSNISTTPGGTAINTTGSQSGTQTVANPSYTKATNNPSYVITEVWGGGGGGGGVAAINGGGGGGASGSYSRQKLLSASLLTSETITIGAGGTAGANTGGAGGTGGTSSFGSHSSAPGGGGGAGSTATSAAYSGGASSVGVGGDLNLYGQPGFLTVYASAGGTMSGAGGCTSLGGGGIGLASTTSAGAAGANNSGSGGSGAVSIASTAGVGGVGGSGFVIVYEYA
jgi:hypothetical protein